MKILMVTNTYLNVVGGLEKSIQSFTQKLRELGHKVLIAGPEFVGEEIGGSQGSHPLTSRHSPLSLPFRGKLEKIIAQFNPDIIHAHHPFLMGEMALRFSAYYARPVIFTYHIMFNQYAHYLPSVSSRLSETFLVEMAKGFCNMSTRVIAPSESVRAILREQGVLRPIDVVPTGIDTAKFAHGNREKKRKELGLSEKSVLLGYVGRLAPEKNLEFMAEQVARLMNTNKNIHFLVVGKGPSEKNLEKAFGHVDVFSRLHFMGALQGQDLVDFYHAMDVFVFASKSETQGLVLCEAMAAGVPVVALDAPGAREVVKDFKNGRLISGEHEEEFQAALAWCADQKDEKLSRMKQSARETVDAFGLEVCAVRALETYRAANQDYSCLTDAHKDSKIGRCFRCELKIMANFIRAAFLALQSMISSGRIN